MEIKPEVETFAKIKVIGVGGSGGNAVERMISFGIKGVEFITINTDIQALNNSSAPIKLNVGKTTTRGLGAGMDPEIGKKSAEESINEIREILKGADMVFITCGLGGGSGSGISPVVAEVAKELGALTVAVVTKPFNFEGSARRAIADAAHQKLAEHVDTIITIENDRILQIVDKKTSFSESLAMVDDVLRQGVTGISEIITIPGKINADFADVKAIMKDQGSALMGIGSASGENRASEAAKAAISSPLLELSMDGAKGILYIISASDSLSMNELNEASKVITQAAEPNSKIIFGVNIDESLGDMVKITVVATGFGGDGKRKAAKEVKLPEVAAPGSLMRGSNFASEENIATIKKEDYTAKTDEEDLDIPAFIRKKMS